MGVMGGGAYVVLTVTAAGLVCAGLWMVSRRLPRGTVLGVCGLLLAGGLMGWTGESREWAAVALPMVVIGGFGGVLGVIDLVWRRGKRVGGG